MDVRRRSFDTRIATKFLIIVLFFAAESSRIHVSSIRNSFPTSIVDQDEIPSEFPSTKNEKLFLGRPIIDMTNFVDMAAHKYVIEAANRIVISSKHESSPADRAVQSENTDETETKRISFNLIQEKLRSQPYLWVYSESLRRGREPHKVDTLAEES